MHCKGSFKKNYASELLAVLLSVLPHSNLTSHGRGKAEKITAHQYNPNTLDCEKQQDVSSIKIQREELNNDLTNNIFTAASK